jgi:ethanolamine utilization protein EutQ (cupin superfamily)
MATKKARTKKAAAKSRDVVFTTATLDNMSDRKLNEIVGKVMTSKKGASALKSMMRSVMRSALKSTIKSVRRSPLR